MSNVLTYQPLHLSTHGRVKQGVVTSNLSGEPVEYKVTVLREYGSGSNQPSYRVMIRKGTEVAVWAGTLVKTAVGRYKVLIADAESKITTTGYEERGSIDLLVETVIHGFLGRVHDAQREAAKTPEERQAEVEARNERARAHQQKRIEQAACDLIGLLNELVPNTTVHYAVEDARRALGTLVEKSNTIKTVGLR